MFLEIITLDRKIFEGEVDCIVVPAKEGELTILPNHIPLISPLKKGKIKVKKEREEKIFEIEEGILRVGKEKVNILIVDYGS